MKKRYVGAIDQGTTSTRFMLFDRSGGVKALAQREHGQIFPAPGRVEHDAAEIWENTCRVIREALSSSGIRAEEIAAVGITNQRETTVVFDPVTGRPRGNAIVWQDTRTGGFCEKLMKWGGKNRFARRTGLPIATYFSGPKIRWLLDHDKDLPQAVEAGRAIFGTIDTWLIWNLTGGPNGGRHVTDATNASRTMLMNIRSLEWDPAMLRVMGVPRRMLPAIGASSDPAFFGRTVKNGPFRTEIPVASDLGDQQAALFGQSCFEPGSVKNTYGTGAFLLMNTGEEPVFSKNGLITTVAYAISGRKPVYALEGSVAVAGALVQWLRDNLGIIAKSSDIDALALKVKDNGGIYIVPAFSGLFAPYWKSTARGVIAGLTRYANKSHLARAVLEATAFQTKEIFEAMQKDARMNITALKVDGGMTKSEPLMQFQSDLLDIPVLRPAVSETTALGAAFAAGLAVGFWKDFEEIRKNRKKSREWKPSMGPTERDRLYHDWKNAVRRTFNWVKS